MVSHIRFGHRLNTVSLRLRSVQLNLYIIQREEEKLFWLGIRLSWEIVLKMVLILDGTVAGVMKRGYIHCR